MATLKELRKEAKEKDGRILIERGIQSTAGKTYSFGSRDYSAAASLVKKGIIEHVKTYKSTFNRNGYSTRVTNEIFKVVKSWD